MRMQLNEAVSKRLAELLSERNMTQYQLFMKSGVPKSTIGNVINCSYESVKLRIIHELHGFLTLFALQKAGGHQLFQNPGACGGSAKPFALGIVRHFL